MAVSSQLLPGLFLGSGGFAAAAFYLLLSGAEVATQRSFFMTTVVLMAVMVAASATSRWISCHEHQEHHVASLAGLVETGKPLLGPGQ